MTTAAMGNLQDPTSGNNPPETAPSGSNSLGQRQDLLRRSTATTLTTNVRVMNRAIRVESNSAELLHLALTFFSSHQYGGSIEPEFVWRIVCEADANFHAPDVRLSAFSDQQLSYVNIGQRGFMAVDHASREAVGFLPDALLKDGAKFQYRPPLDILFCMTASSLGLVPLSGGCVAANGRAVMVFGPPNSGKTTSCYLAASSGLEFQADQVVFLEARNHQVWGDPLPAVFRPESVRFLPELEENVIPSNYEDCFFYYFDKSKMQSPEARPVTPVCSLFLDRQSGGQTELRQISHDEAFSLLRECVLFEERSELEERISSALHSLADKPVYQLRYNSDPALAARYIEKMLG